MAGNAVGPHFRQPHLDAARFHPWLQIEWNGSGPFGCPGIVDQRVAVVWLVITFGKAARYSWRLARRQRREIDLPRTQTSDPKFAQVVGHRKPFGHQLALPV